MLLFKNEYRLALLFAALLVGCGSSSDSADTDTGTDTTDTTAPTTAVEPTLTISSVKTFSFSWSDVDDATYYQLLENADGSSGFSQVGDDIAAGVQAVDITVPLYNRTNASYIVSACNTVGCADSSTLTVGDNINDGIGYFKASDTGEDDRFGSSVALNDDGTVLAISAPEEESNATTINGDDANNEASSAGAVYVFHLLSDGWQQQAYLKANNAGAGDRFGSSISLSGDGTTLAVGASFEDSTGTGVDGEQNDSGNGQGAVYVFEFDGSAWAQQVYLKASNNDNTDFFGAAVSLSDNGDTLAVGAIGEESLATGVNPLQSDNSVNFAGAVYLFSRSGTTWSQSAYLKASNTSGNDQFGHAISLSGEGTTMAVGVPQEDSTGTGVDGAQNDLGSNNGAVYLFEFDGSTWAQQAYLKASNSDQFDHFGTAVSLSDNGDTLAVGARFEESNATTVNGEQDNDDAPDSGAAYVFSRSGSSWSQTAYLKASNNEADDYFGRALSLTDDGTLLAVSSALEDSDADGLNGDASDNNAEDAGATYLFALQSGSWSQTAYIKTSNSDADDSDTGTLNFAASTYISLSGDGHTLAVGASGEASAATGIDGDQDDNSLEEAGAVYLY